MHYEQPDGVQVHDGFPNPATDTSLQSLDLHSLLIRNNASTFLMRISGDEWQRYGIFHDDIAVVDRALAIRASDIVVWHKDGELAVSYRSEMPKNATAWGVVSSIIHQYRRST